MIYKKDSNEQPKKIVFLFVFGAFFGRNFHINFLLFGIYHELIFVNSYPKSKRIRQSFCMKFSEEKPTYFTKTGSYAKKNREILKY